MSEYYLTKYALSKVIHKVNGEPSQANPSLILVKGLYNVFRLSKDIFENVEDAFKKAEKMRDKKIKSLEKQLEKLRNMKFEIK